MVSTIELIDRFQALLHLESTTYQFNNYLQHQSGRDELCQDKKSWRIEICGWMYHVVDSQVLDRELVYIAMTYMDRYLSTHSVINHQHHYQLVGMTSLYMAIKIFRYQGKCAAVASFTNLSKESFTVNDILNTEKSILDTLQWRMHPPTPQSFLELLIIFLPRGACSPFTRHALFERIKFLVELSTTVQFFFGKKPSSVAVAAFIEVMENEQEPNVSKQSCRSHFRHCTRSIAGICCDSDEVIMCRNAMKVVYKKSLHQMVGAVMNERECTGSPVASEYHDVSAVTP